MRPSNKNVQMEAFEALSASSSTEEEEETPLQEGNNNSNHKRRKRTESSGRKRPIREKRKLRDQTTTTTPTMLSTRVEQDEVKNKLRPDVMTRDRHHRHREMCSRQQEATTLRWVKRQSATKRALTVEERKQVKANATKAEEEEKEEEEGKQPPEPDKHSNKNKEEQKNSLLDLDPLLLLDFKWLIDWLSKGLLESGMSQNLVVIAKMNERKAVLPSLWPQASICAQWQWMRANEPCVEILFALCREEDCDDEEEDRVLFAWWQRDWLRKDLL